MIPKPGKVVRKMPSKFGFRQNHGTIEQVNRITSEIRTAFEHREYCSAIFLDVSQAFDRVGLDGLMHKIKTHLPDNTHKLLESYLYTRTFAVRCNQKHPTTTLSKLESRKEAHWGLLCSSYTQRIFPRTSS